MFSEDKERSEVIDKKKRMKEKETFFLSFFLSFILSKTEKERMKE